MPSKLFMFRNKEFVTVIDIQSLEVIKVLGISVEESWRGPDVYIENKILIANSLDCERMMAWDVDTLLPKWDLNVTDTNSCEGFNLAISPKRNFFVISNYESTLIFSLDDRKLLNRLLNGH